MTRKSCNFAVFPPLEASQYSNAIDMTIGEDSLVDQEADQDASTQATENRQRK